MPTIRSMLLSAGVALAALSLPAGASAVNVTVGLGDQNASMFDQQPFKDLGLKRVRYFIHWDAAKDPYQLQQADVFVDTARRNGVKVFMTPSTNDLRSKKAKLPSVSQYKRQVGKLVRRYRAMGVEEWGVWNEANHTTQPTYRSPKRAAQFFQAMYQLCKGCKIVALDVLDQTNPAVGGYIAKFYQSLNSTWRKRANIVGIHNYSDVNRKRAKGTLDAFRTTRRYNSRAKFWLTETGGLVNFGRAWPCNEQRAANRITYMFKFAKKYDRYIDRLYAYAYWGDDCQGFDAGLVNADGSIRPGYNAFKKGLRGFKK
ncbi:MAG: hypothetical protein IRZ32_03515 [Solirubrobacteraceae bacterium]|nr:hypothetical protein [Solirubrobacteraceae bacterium]